MKTDLARTITVPGQRGLFKYVAQARNGVIVESLSTGKRMICTGNMRISALDDISIYTDEGELKLKEVFLKLKEVLGEELPSETSSDEQLKELFAKAVPAYDETKFHLSHMKKVVQWYVELVKYASLDFEAPEEQAEETE